MTRALPLSNLQCLAPAQLHNVSDRGQPRMISDLSAELDRWVRFAAPPHRPLLSIMISKLGNEQILSGCFVDHSVFVSNSPGPVPRQGVAQRFGLAKPLEWMSRRILYQLVYSLNDPGIGSLPEQVIIPSLIGKNEPHGSKTILRFLPLPNSSAWIAARSRRAFVGLRRRWAVSCNSS